MQVSPSSHNLLEIGPGFWNLRASFKLGRLGLVEIGNHMSFIRLQSGRILVIDTCLFSDATKAEIDTLTENGNLIEAVVATHPYHTLAFKPFFQLYPNAKYIGTPRHLSILPEIPWSGKVNDEEIISKWAPEVSMRIPQGSDFVTPGPDNHFAGVFVYHQASRTIHIDDTLTYFMTPTFLMRWVGGVRPCCLEFHGSLTTVGLLPLQDAPELFTAFIESIILDWDFDNICCAHSHCIVGGAKDKLKKTLQNSEKIFQKLKEKHKKYV